MTGPQRIALALCALGSCGGPQSGTGAERADRGVLPLVGDVGEASAVAMDESGQLLVAAGQSDDRAVVARVRAKAPTWVHREEHVGKAVAVAIGGDVVVAATKSTSQNRPPTSALVALATEDGALRWRFPIEATGYAAVRGVATTPAGEVIAVGGFSGSLRVGDQTVHADGLQDGFIVALSAAGKPSWVVRFGGPGGDYAHSVAATRDQIFVAGAFGESASVGAVTVQAQDESIDAVLIGLNRAGEVVWAKSVGGKGTESPAGVAVAGDTIGLAATFEGSVLVAGEPLTSRGSSDILLAAFGLDGQPRWAQATGSPGLDGATSLAGLGDRFAVAGHLAEAGTGGDKPSAAFLATLPAAGSTTGWELVDAVRTDGDLRYTGLAGAPTGALAASATLRGTVAVGATQITSGRQGGGVVLWLPPPRQP